MGASASPPTRSGLDGFPALRQFRPAHPPPMSWYYAEGRERRGPISASEIQQLIAAGSILPATLVWNDTMAEWKPASETSLFASVAGAAPVAATQKCIITGKMFPVNQMIRTEHGWVSAEGKDLYYQSLRENAPLPTAAGVSNARRDGNKIVVPVSGAQLPRRCVKTNQPVTETEVKNKTLYWYPPLIALSILISLLIFLILYLVMRKKIIIDIPLSRDGRGIVRKHWAIVWALLLGGVVLFIAGIANIDRAGWLIVIGLLVGLAGLIYSAYKGVLLRPTKLKDGEVWLAGACPEFLDSLPKY